jgi:peptide/nickel transport system substrate-binding protein
MQNMFDPSVIRPPVARRSLMLGGIAAGAALGLAACGDQKEKAASGQGDTDLEARGTSGEIEDLVDNNPHDVDELEKGGTLTLTLGNLGPNFNASSNGGNNADAAAIQNLLNVTGVWNADTEGNPVLNKDFCTDAKYDDSGDKPVITYTLNPDAVWNDGTPYDWKTFENQWHMMSGEDPDVDVVATDGYERIAKVEAGKDDHEVVVTMKEIYQPWEDLFAGTIHPDINTAKIFNDGFVNDIHPEWTAGPFKLDKLDNAQKRVIFEPNDAWWGEKPVLDSIVYQQMDSDSTIPAFRNGEIDEASIGNASRYKEAEDIKEKDVRRSQNLSISGMNFNTKKGNLGDIAVRKAIYQGLDRKALADLRFNGMNWTEELPGSWMLMPFSPYYQDNYPVEYDRDAAKKTLEDAGWTGEDGKVREKDGKKLEVALTNFGDDPVGNAVAQTLQKNLTELGFDAQIDSRGDGDFGKVMEDQDFELIMMAYGVGPDPTGVVNQFFNSKASSNFTGTGTDEIDEIIPKVPVDEDVEERAKLANEAEKKFQELYAMMPLYNGPVVTALKPGLANYGPQLFEDRDWAKVGWEEGKKQG